MGDSTSNQLTPCPSKQASVTMTEASPTSSTLFNIRGFFDIPEPPAPTAAETTTESTTKSPAKTYTEVFAILHKKRTRSPEPPAPTAAEAGAESTTKSPAQAYAKVFAVLRKKRTRSSSDSKSGDSSNTLVGTDSKSEVQPLRKKRTQPPSKFRLSMLPSPSSPARPFSFGPTVGTNALDFGYETVKELGTGGNAVGMVTLLQDRMTAELVAKKVVKRTVDVVSQRWTFPPEAAIMLSLQSKCNSDFLVHLLAVHECTPGISDCSLLLEYCPGGSLDQYLDAAYFQHHLPVPEPLIWRVVLQMARGIALLHTGHGTPDYHTGRWTPVVHLDIKPYNAFVVPNPLDTLNPTIKIGDFGFAHHYTQGYLDIKGTASYLPPEFPYLSPAADIWALGGTIYFMARQQDPPCRCSWYAEGYPELEGAFDFSTLRGNDDVLARQMRQVLGLRQRVPINEDTAYDGSPAHRYSNALNHVLWMCWQPDYNCRIKADELVQWLEPAAETALEILARGQRPTTRHVCTAVAKKTGGLPVDSLLLDAGNAIEELRK